MRHLGHVDCGVYAEIEQDGAIAEGEVLTPARPAQEPLAFG